MLKHFTEKNLRCREKWDWEAWCNADLMAKCGVVRCGNCNIARSWAAFGIRSVLLVMLALSVCVPCEADQAAVTNSSATAPAPGSQYSQFREFMSPARPPIKFLLFRRSANQFLLNGRPIANDVTYEASFQSNTYYVKQLTSVFDPTNAGPIGGSSYGNVWYINETRQVSVEGFSASTSAGNTPPDKLSGDLHDVVGEALNLGIAYLDLDSVKWVDDETFQASSSIASRGTISGRILEGDGVAPKLIEYNYSGLKGARFTITCRHENNRVPDWLPNTVVMTVALSNGKGFSQTNTIEELTYGVSTLGSNGYEYAQFMPANTIYTNANLVEYSSNGVATTKVGDIVVKVAAASNYKPLSGTSKTLVRVAFFVLLATGVLLLGWLTIRANRIRKRVI